MDVSRKMVLSEHERRIFLADMSYVHKQNTKHLAPDLREVLDMLEKILTLILEKHVLSMYAQDWYSNDKVKKEIKDLHRELTEEISWAIKEIAGFKRLRQKAHNLLNRGTRSPKAIKGFLRSARSIINREGRWERRASKSANVIIQKIESLKDSSIPEPIKRELVNIKEQVKIYNNALTADIGQGFTISPIKQLFKDQSDDINTWKNEIDDLMFKKLEPFYVLIKKLDGLTLSMLREAKEHVKESMSKKLKDLEILLEKLYQKEYISSTGNIPAYAVPGRKRKVEETLIKIGNQPKGSIVDLEKLLKDKLGTEEFPEIEAQSDKIVSIIIEIHNQMEDLLKSKNPELMDVIKKSMVKLFDEIVNQINRLSYVDTILDQLKQEVYSIEEHLIKELQLRKKYQTIFNKGGGPIVTDTYKVYVFTAESLVIYKQNHPNAQFKGVYKPVTETKRVEQLSKFLDDVAKDKNKAGSKIMMNNGKNEPVAKALKKLKVDKSNLSTLFLKDKYVALKDHYGVYTFHTNEKGDRNNFSQRLINYLIFHKNKEQNIDEILNAISEPWLLSAKERLAFFNYRKARKITWKTIKTMIDNNVAQGDIPPRVAGFMKGFMEKGLEAVSSLQDAVAKAKGDDLNLRFSNFINRPFLVHQLLMTILKLAIFSEGRAFFNRKGELIYAGRESGFEGGNTIALHSHNNFIKYSAIVDLITPKLKDLEIVMDAAEHFKGWLIMALHDVGTVDKQNSLDFGSEEQRYGNENKRAHNIIGAWYLKENELIKKLFEEDVQDVEKHQDINMLAEVSMHHDNGDLMLDLEELSKLDNPRLAKEYVLKTCCAISDHSAGIACSINGKVDVDPWAEKGSTIFEVGNGPHYLLEILQAVQKFGFGGASKNLSTRIGIIRKEMIADLEGSDLDPVRKRKFIRNIERLNVFAAKSVAGVINSGVIEFKKYDGKTLHLTIYFDKDLNDILSKKIGVELSSARLIKFLAEFNRSFKGSKDEIEKKIYAKDELLIPNLDANGEPLKSFGLAVTFKSKKGLAEQYLKLHETKKFLRDLELSKVA